MKNHVANVVVVLEDAGCEGNRRGYAAVVYRSEALMGREAGDSEDLQWAEVTRFGDGHTDIPTGEDPITEPPSGRVDQLADITGYDA
ncbi:hypothetical protein ACXPWS_22860 [Mycobacterium sp. BMJ-28]